MRGIELLEENRMKISKRLLSFISMLLIFLPAKGSLATTVSGKASTALEFYENVLGETAVPFYQYLNLNIRDIAEKGYSFRSYGRLAKDLANEDDVESRLYYAYIEKRDFIKDNLDVRLGRQFISSAAGASLLDGIVLKAPYDGLGKRIKFTFFGGGDLGYYSDYQEQDLILGLEATSEVYENFNIGLSTVQKWNSGDMTYEIFGGNLDYRIPGHLHVYTDLQYNWLKAEFSEILAGLKFHGNPHWSLRAEYIHSIPIFSANSIYSAFDTSEYEEVMAEATYKLDQGLQAFGRYTRELYKDYDDANVYEMGIEKIRTRTKRISGYLSVEIRDDDDGQNEEGVKFHVGYLVQRYLNVGVGAHYNVIERRLDDENDELTSGRYWFDTSFYLNKKMNLQFKLERLEDEVYGSSFRGRLRFNVKF